ncbi:MAG: bile acid:sodium symporter [Planctomycetota bacterium]
MFDRYHEFESLFASIQVVLVMLGMGMTISPAEFMAIARQPRSLFVGCLCQFLLAPVLTWITISLIPLDAGISVGLLLISAMPGGPLANLYTFLARGNVALSVSLTGIATIGSLLSVPLLLETLARGHVPPEIPMPVEKVLVDVLLFLLAPLACGMVFLRLAPRWATSVSPWLIRAGLVILVLMVTGSLGSGRIEPLSYGWTTPVVIIVLCVAIQNLSMALFPIFRWPVADQTAVGIGVTIRNVNLALLLAARLFPSSTESASGKAIGGGVLYVALFWGALSLVVCLSSIFFQRRALEAESARLHATQTP